MAEPNQSSGVNESERHQYLASLQATTTMTMIPAMVFLIILSVTGLVGNSFVLFVYSQRFTRTSTRVFVLAIAAFDLVANVIGIPGEIFDMFHIWDFNNPPFCRARLFFNAFSTLSSAMALLAVAVTRYRKVCFPYGWQTSIKQARIVSLIITLMGILFSIPYVILNGHQTKKTPRPDIFGSECTTDDSYVNTIWPLLNNGFFVVLFLACCIPFTILYIKIGLQAWRHSVVHGARDSQNPSSYITNTSSVGIIQGSINNNNPASQIKPDPTGTRRESLQVAVGVETGFESVTEVISQLGDELNGMISSDNYTVVIQGRSVEVSPVQMGEFIVQLKKAASSGDSDALKGIDVERDSIVRQNVDAVTEYGKVEHRNGSLNSISTASVCHHIGQTTTRDCNHDSGIKSSEIIQDVTHGLDNMGYVDDSGMPISFVNPTFTSTETSHPESAFSSTLSRNFTESNITCHLTPVTTPNGSPQIHRHVSESEIPQNQTHRLDPASKDTVTFNTQKSGNDVETPPSSSIQQNESKKSQDEDVDKPETFAVTPFCVEIFICKHAGSDQCHTSVDTTEHCTKVSLRISSTNVLLQKNEWVRSLVAISTSGEKSSSEANPSVDVVLEHPNEPTTDDRTVTLPDQVAVRQRSKNDRKDPRSSKNVMSRIKTAMFNTRTLQRFSASGAVRRPLSRTTAMLITISVVYIVGFLPYLILVFYRLIWPERYSSQTMSEEAAYNLFLRTYFLNCAANPIIYGVCDKNFRRECISLLKC